MATTALSKKLGIKPGQSLLVMNSPDGYLESLGEPDIATEPCGEAGFEFVQAFVYNKADVDSIAGTALQTLKPGRLVWFSYPKKSSKIETDTTPDVGWDSLRKAGFRSVSMVSIDDTWSGFRFQPIQALKSRKTG